MGPSGSLHSHPLPARGERRDLGSTYHSLLWGQDAERAHTTSAHRLVGHTHLHGELRNNSSWQPYVQLTLRSPDTEGQGMDGKCQLSVSALVTILNPP